MEPSAPHPQTTTVTNLTLYTTLQLWKAQEVPYLFETGGYMTGHMSQG